MPQDAKVYKVFISSPNNLSEDRQVAEAAVRMVSRSYESRGVRVEPWRWEENVTSEFGKTPQQIIFGQLGEYDLYIGLMGTRFGSPTECYGSGTEEEFEGAIRLLDGGGILRVGFLFKNVQLRSADLSEQDLAQLQKVLAFKGRITRNGIYQEFDTQEELSLKVQSLVVDAIDRDLQKERVAHQYSLLTGDGQTGVPTISRGFFDDTLNYLDEDISNGARTRLTLDDIWIDPDLRRLSDFAELAMVRHPYDMKTLCADVEGGRSLVVFGGELCGRSSLCKKVYLDLYTAGYLPVLLNGNMLNNTEIDRFLQRVRLAYAVQYENLSVDAAKRIPKEKVIIIIDDLDKAKLSSRRILSLLSLIPNHCRSILASTSALFATSIFDFDRDLDAVRSIGRVEIRQIGHKARYQLIERWCLAGQKSTVDDEGLRALIERKRRTIDRVLGANLVPRTPIIVLILLVAIEVGQVGDLAHAGYVRYYKFLIDAAILRSTSREDAEIAYAFLPELAWAIHETEAQSLDQRSYDGLIEEFASRRALRATRLYSALTSLQRVGMFETGPNGLRFKHQYVFLYFLGDYVGNHLDMPLIQTKVRTLCDDITADENSNILIFTSFFSNSATVIEHLKRNLSNSFASAKQFEFSDRATQLINNLVDHLPEEVVDPTKFSQNRVRRLEANDTRHERQAELNSQDRSARTSEFHKAFTSIEVLGHILRNHYAKLDARPKEEIFEAAMCAGLRWLGSILEFLSTSADTLIKFFQAFVEGIDLDESAKSEGRAKKIVFDIVVYLTYFAVRRMSHALGEEDLAITYQHVNAQNSPMASDFLEFAIKLDCFREFPIADLKSLSERFRNDRLGMTLLRIMVKERLDMRPPNAITILRQICNLTEMDLKPLLAARL